MKLLLAFFMTMAVSQAFAVSWSYQVNVNGKPAATKDMDAGKVTFDAGPYYCEVTPIKENNLTEYRTLTCSVGSGTVSTGGLCTQKASKFASVQYAILNLNGPKTLVNVVVACKF